MGALRKWGGPRSHRLLRLNVGAPSLRTVERAWNRDLFHYLPGINEATFIQLAKLLAPKVAALELREGEKLPCEFEQDETPVLPELTCARALTPSPRHPASVTEPSSSLLHAQVFRAS